MRKIYTTLIALFSIAFAYGQTSQTKDTVAIMHSYKEGVGMQLKWLPRNTQAFFDGFNNGYVIYRAEAITQGTTERLSDYEQLTQQPLMHWDLDKFVAEYEQDSAIAIAGMIIGAGDSLTKMPPAANADEAANNAKAQSYSVFIASLGAVVNNRTAEALGLYFVDKTAYADRKYVYRIEIPGYDQWTSYLLVMPSVGKKKERVVGFKSVLQPDAIYLSWFNNDYRTFPYYNIYRSTNKSKGFVKLNPIPYMGNQGDANMEKLRTVYVDSFPQYDTKYFYKVVGVNAFGEEGLYSDVIEQTSFYQLKNRPMIIRGESPDNSTIELEWEVFPEDEPYIKGFSISRASRGEGPYVQLNEGLIGAKKRTYVDNSSKGSSNYYHVCAYGNNGDSLCSLLKAVLLVDSFPPAKPEVLTGVCDTNGVVRVSWKLGPEPDIVGYRVFKTYLLEKEPVRVTEYHVSDTVMYDFISLKAPYNKIYYRIAAIDANMNPSVPSEFFEVQIPDINPPTNGYLENYSVSIKGISIKWHNSSAYDLKYMHLMRKSKYDVDFQPILSLSGDSLSITSYLDTTTKSNEVYEYAVEAEDEAGLRSGLSPSMSVKQRSKKRIISVTNLESYVSRDNKVIKLVWEYPQRAVGFKIYRAENDGKLQTYEFTPGDKREFYDKWVKPNTTYTYMMVAELQGGGTSGYSEKIEVKY